MPRRQPKYGAAGRDGARHTRQPSLRPGWPSTFPGRQVRPPQPHRGATRSPTDVSRAPARRQRTPRFTNQAVPAWPGRDRYPSAPSPSPAAPERERQHPKRAPTASPSDRLHRPRAPSTLQETQAPGCKLAPHPQPAPPPQPTTTPNNTHTTPLTQPPAQTLRAGHSLCALTGTQPRQAAEPKGTLRNRLRAREATLGER